MEKRLVALSLVCLALAFRVNAAGGPPGPAGLAAAAPAKGVALVITGAAARIPQEAALLEALDERGLLKDLAFVSGDSSGALNAIAVNAIKSGRMTWARYRQILEGIRNGDIFVQSDRKLPVDTSPLRAMLKRVIEGEMGFRTMGDLPIPTSISITRFEDLGLEKTAYRMCSERINAESDPSLSIVDILMASTAIPVVFPAVRIPGVTTIKDIEYVDGGAGEDYVPYEAVLEFEQARARTFDKVFIVSRKSNTVPEVSEELRALGVNDRGLFDKLGISPERLASRLFLKYLGQLAKQAPGLAGRTFVWRPDFQASFLLLDFNSLGAQYAATREWARNSAPVPLLEYLSEGRSP